MILMVDVDITVVDTPKEWIDWLKQISSSSEYVVEEYLNHNKKLPYRIGDLFKDLTHEQSQCFWKKRDIYDKLDPVPFSASVLRYAKEQLGFDVIFCSMCSGEHYNSKHEFIKRHFPFYDGFVSTSEKQYVRCDIMIDDRLEFINAMPYNTYTLLIDSKFEQTQKNMRGPHNHADVKDWLHILDILNSFEVCKK